MSDDFRRAFGRAVGRAYDSLFIYGRLGRANDNGSTSVNVADRPGFSYVTLAQDGNFTVSVALNPAGSRVVNLPVKLRRIDGVLVIVGVDDRPGVLSAFAGGGSVGAGPHTHRSGSGLEYEAETFWLDAGRVLWSGTAVTVRIRPFWYRVDGERVFYPGGTLDLASDLPTTTDQWAWIGVGLDTATNTAVAFTGDEYAAQADLTDARIADVDMAGAIPLGAVQAQEGDTALSDWRRYRDIRHWLDQRDRLDDLTNVALTTPAAGEVLTYDDGSGLWVNAEPVTDVAGAIHAADPKATPHDDDEFGYANSEDSWALVKATWANLKTALTTLFNTLYLVRAGLSGGQTAYGGTASGDDLILESTSHATKGDVLIQPNGGNVGIDATPNSSLSIRAGASADHANVGGVIHVNLTPASNVGTGEDNLMTFDVPANTLAVDGDSLWFEAWGSGLADIVRVGVRFGASGVNSIIDNASFAGATEWAVRGRIVRAGAATQHAYAVMHWGSFSEMDRTLSLDRTLSGGVTFRITGEGLATGDVTCEGLIIGWHPANS